MVSSDADQLAALLETARVKLRECEDKLAWRRGHELAAIFDHLNDTVTEFYEPAHYRSAIEKLEAHCSAHPDDLAALLSLGNAYLLRSVGGRAAWWRITSLIVDNLDPAGAVPVFERARALAPDDPEISRMLRRAKRGCNPPIILAALPRSGSVYLSHSLTHGLGKMGYGGLMGGAFPHFSVCTENLLTAIKLRVSTHTHISPSRTNLLEMGVRVKLDRLLVHVRDPRQAMASFFYFMPDVVQRNDPVQLLHYDVPEDYWTRSAEHQLDWQIDHWLPGLVGWIKGWVDAANEPWFKTRILYTTFERMAADSKAFFDEILAFYDIDPNLFDYPDRPTAHGDRNFRRGEIDEWRGLLTPGQIDRASSLIPDELYERFGWPRR
jgi:sulfotransferase family protein